MAAGAATSTRTSVTWQKVPGAMGTAPPGEAGGARWETLFAHREAGNHDLGQCVVDAEAVNAVGVDAGLWRRSNDGSIDEVVNLVRADSHFERVGGFTARVELRHRGVGRAREDVLDRLAVALFHQPRPVLRNREIRVALVRTVKVLAPEDQPEVVRMAAPLILGERRLQRVVPGRRVLRIPEDRCLRIGCVKAAA